MPEDDWKNRVKTVVIVLSTGRTGTAALAHFFNTSYDDVTALHEPKPNRHLRVMSNRAVARGLKPATATRVLSGTRKRLLNSLTRPVYIESNWYLYGFLDALRPVYGKPKVLHVTRDPRTFIPSYLNYGTFRGLKKVATSFMPYWYLRPEQCDVNPFGRPWKHLTEAERLGWQWYAVNREIDRALATFGDDYLRVRYEDLFDPDGPTLRTLLAWIGLPANQKLAEQMRNERVNASTGRGNAAWEKIDAASRASILKVCGEQMARYGYRTDDTSTG
jgi:hypothetical protein